MRIGILGFRSYDSYDFKSELRLKAAAEERGHVADLLSVTEMSFNPQGQVLLKGAELPHFDGFISRARVIDQVENRLFVLKLLEEQSHVVINGYEGLIQSKNKWFATEALRKAGVTTVPTWVVEDEAVVVKVAEEIGYPVVVKAAYGTFGLSVEKAENEAELKEMLWRFWRPEFITPLLLQPLIREAAGKDHRVFVVGGKVICTMERQGLPGDFRAYSPKGTSGVSVAISLEEEALAIAAVKAFNLDYAGVDVIQTLTGPAVLEVNGNAGLMRIARITGVDVAGAIIELAVSRFQKS